MVAELRCREYQDVEIAKITAGERMRTLVASIQDGDLLEPIGLTRDRRLVFGLHRREACKRLGHQEIRAVVREYSREQAELAEIDENYFESLQVIEKGCNLRFALGCGV